MTTTPLLRKLPLFSSCSDEELERIDALVDELYVTPGAPLTVEGATDGNVFVIVSGVADVHQAGETTGRVGAGDVVGEMAVLEDAPRCATVVARTPVHALVVDGDGFDALMAHRDVATRVASLLSRRLRQRSRALPDLDPCVVARCC